jgi:hypothetical protein
VFERVVGGREAFACIHAALRPSSSLRAAVVWKGALRNPHTCIKRTQQQQVILAALLAADMNPAGQRWRAATYKAESAGVYLPAVLLPAHLRRP